MKPPRACWPDAAAVHAPSAAAPRVVPDCRHRSPHLDAGHEALRPRVLLAWMLLVAPAVGHGTTPAAAAAPVTVYRCSDSRGQLLALRDSPCHAGEQQEAVQMQRPRDPPPRPVVVAPAAPAAQEPREIRVVTVQPPQPMFECTDPTGQVYVSDSDEGTLRWVPLWASVPAWRPGRPRPPIGPPQRPPVAPLGAGPRPPQNVVVAAGGTWVRDPCVRLPQDEVCRRLSDRRFEILRIYHAAMPSGRAELDREQRQIDARMANDCR